MSTDDEPQREPWEWVLLVILFLGLACLCCGDVRCECHYSSTPNPVRTSR